MRTLSTTLTLLLCLAVLGACGGAGGGTAGPTALLSGKVTIVDGSDADLAGIRVESLGDGATVVTGPDGSFRLHVVPGERIVLAFEDPDHPAREEGEGPRDPDEREDETPDGADIDGDEVQLDPVGADERCEIEVEIEDGEVVECRVDRPDNKEDGEDRPRFEAECRLKPIENSSEPEAIAEAEIVCESDCCVLEIEVEGVLFATQLTVAVECKERVIGLGTIEIREGRGHFELDSCENDLELDIDSVYELRGCLLLLLDENEDVALFGCVPGEREEEEKEKDRFVEDCGLEPVDGSSEPEAEGAAILSCEDGTCKLVVEVGGVFEAEAFDVVIECGDRREELGVIEIVEGGGRFAETYGGDAERPFDVESLRALGECDLLLLDGEGDVALRGCFPGERKEKEGDGEKGEGDGEKGEGDKREGDGA